ncbi:PAS domain S-box [Aciduliprofundum sp. MAR08-339]|uniref:PAS domain S-box protein n=1 Tax=Aciduliprofundum sp. (strain MAR08-339) TaxID=673860 RepID=UPI0002A49C82|nr:PAS domain S-box [Aciduliprofundum sp. MAR08-339]
MGDIFSFKYSPPGVVVVDKEFKIINADSNARNILNYDPTKENFLDYLDERSRKILRDRISSLSDSNGLLSVNLNLSKNARGCTVEALAVEDNIVLHIWDESQKRMEVALKLLSSSIGNILEMVMVTDKSGRILYVNPAFTRITGYRPEEVIGRTPEFLNSGLYDKKFYRDICERVAQGNIWHGVIVNRKKNGELYTEEMTIVPVTGESGEVEYMVSLKYDITDKKVHEQELMRRSNLLSALYNISLKMGGFPDLRYMGECIYEELKKVMNFKSFLFGIYKEEMGEIYYPYGRSDTEDMTEISIKFDPEHSLAGRVIYTKKPLLIRDLSKEFSPEEYMVVGSKEMEKSAMFVPIIYRDRVLGLLVVSTPAPNIYTEEDLKYMEIIANFLAIFIENANLFKNIKETKERYETLINTSLAGVGITDEDYRLTFVNSRLARMAGYEPEEMLGRQVFDFLSEDSRDVFIEKHKNIKRGLSEVYEARIIRKDGATVDILVNASPLRDGKGNVKGAIGVAIDITERNKLMNKLREEWEKYRTALENVLVGIAILHDGKIIFVNKTMKDMLGYSEEDLLNKNFLKIVHPDMRDILWSNYNRRMAGENIPDTYVAKLIDSKGNPKWCMVRGTIVEWEGKKVDMMSAQDITALKEMEDKLLAMVSMFESMKMARKEDELFTMVIDAITNVLGIKDVVITEMQGDGAVIRRYGGMGGAVDLEGIKIVNRGIVGWVVRNKKPYYAPDVSRDPWYFNANPHTKSEYATPIMYENRIFGVLNVESDKVDGISEDDRKLIDLIASHLGVSLASLEYQRNLERAKEFQELLIHIVSHDLKNPLAVIQGYLELIKEESSHEFLDTMADALEEANGIINKARLFSKLGINGTDLKKDSANISEMLDKSIALIRKKYPDAKIINKVGYLNMKGFTLLKEAFVNILDNAFKYGASEVKIYTAENENYVLIHFADDGPGIPDSKKELIFEPFKRLHSGEGSGLGLSIVRMIMELHGGSVEIKNNEPRGSVFVLKIPKNMP